MALIRETTASSKPVEAATGRVEFSIVIPCLDEERTLGRCIASAQGALEELGIRGEIVVADNGSTDASAAIAERLGARVVDVQERGYGAALREGVLRAHGDYVIMGDADGSYDFQEIGVFVDRLRAGYDVVVGNRFEGGIEAGAMPLLHRYLGNPVLSLMGRRLFGSRCGDIYCGLRGFRREAVLGLDLRSIGMEYAIEMVVKATLAGLRVAEVPIRLSPDGREHKPHLRTWRDGWRSLRLLLLYSPRGLFLYPGLVLTFVGAAAMIWLLPEQRTVGDVTFDIHTLFYAAIAVVVGFQALLFAVLANAFAVAEGLLPRAARFRPPFRWLSLEAGFLSGFLLIVVGFASVVTALVIWHQHSFGHFGYSHSMRYVIPGGVALALGFELVFASFLMSLLGMRKG